MSQVVCFELDAAIVSGHLRVLVRRVHFNSYEVRPSEFGRNPEMFEILLLTLGTVVTLSASFWSLRPVRGGNPFWI